MVPSGLMEVSDRERGYKTECCSGAVNYWLLNDGLYLHAVRRLYNYCSIFTGTGYT